MFDELHSLAELHGYIMSLYIDDIAFSSATGIANPKSFAKQVNQILHSYGDSLNAGKTRYSSSMRFSHVTGVALDGSGVLHVGNSLRMKIITGMKAVKEGDVSSYDSTVGRICAARQIEPGLFPSVEKVLNESGGSL